MEAHNSSSARTKTANAKRRSSALRLNRPAPDARGALTAVSVFLSACRHSGKPDFHSRACPWLALNGQPTAMQFGQPPGDVQSQAQALLLVQFPVELHVGTHLG